MNDINNTIDFLAIGDVVNDDFIQLEESQATVTCDANGNECMISMNFGDKLPYHDRKLIYAVGNSPNGALGATRLGLDTALMTHVGNDELGQQTITAMEGRGINTDFVITEPEKTTNYHFVLRYKAERTILIKHEAYTYDLAKQVEGKPTPKWIYFSSVGEDSMQYHKDIAQWVSDKNIKMAFQPGTFQIKLGYEPLKYIYEACELFFCNVEEAEKILGPVIGIDPITDKRETTTRKQFTLFLMQEMSKLGPDTVCITDGPDGAYAYDGAHAWYMPTYPDPAPPVDRTGAGDSFSSTFTSALALGNDIPTALSWGPINSMSVVQHVGAQEGLLTKEQLLEYLADAPEEYVAEQLM
ncbi:MAG: ribokinase [Planctomycetota bacterium]|jgi:ribokinase